MVTKSVRQTKAQLSALIRKVKGGETVLVTDRRVPVVSIVPVERSDCPDVNAWLSKLQGLHTRRKIGLTPPRTVTCLDGSRMDRTYWTPKALWLLLSDPFAGAPLAQTFRSCRQVCTAVSTQMELRLLAAQALRDRSIDADMVASILGMFDRAVSRRIIRLVPVEASEAVDFLDPAMPEESRAQLAKLPSSDLLMLTTAKAADCQWIIGADDATERLCPLWNLRCLARLKRKFECETTTAEQWEMVHELLGRYAENYRLIYPIMEDIERQLNAAKATKASPATNEIQEKNAQILAKMREGLDTINRLVAALDAAAP
jgi:antitoxin (DNA-binding transcriptional repressor) of toxin-antitoxin stability system